MWVSTDQHGSQQLSYCRRHYIPAGVSSVAVANSLNTIVRQHTYQGVVASCNLAARKSGNLSKWDMDCSGTNRCDFSHN
jgi:hypothetical protein